MFAMTTASLELGITWFMLEQNKQEKETRGLKVLVAISLISILVFVIANAFNVFDILITLMREQGNFEFSGSIPVLIVFAGAFGVFSWRQLRKRHIARKTNPKSEI